MLNETHDPALRSWVPSANAAGNDFPVQNLPMAVFRRAGTAQAWRGGVAIGDRILDLAAVHASRALAGAAQDAVAACAAPALNDFLELGPPAWSALRLALSRALREGSPARRAFEPCLVEQAAAQFAVPADIGDYTDFYTSVHHATHIGRLFRPDDPLPPNYKWVPIGYHGRASSIVVSGHPVRRPRGQVMPPGASRPEFVPSRRLDFELELGVFLGRGNELGVPIDVAEAESHIFGLCLLNDWSARDVQAWEYQPLGPFLSKNFATTISPWIVTLEALAPYRVAWTRPAEDPQPLAYLDSDALRRTGALDISLEVLLQTPHMCAQQQPPASICTSNYRHAYWTLAQIVAHHAVGGCNLRAGDLLGTGTLSGPGPAEAGALIELTEGGKRPLLLPGGETRTFLEDGDRVVLRAWCEGHGAARIGFGEAVGTLEPAFEPRPAR
jgi:fumarylacetoacetase